MRLFDLFTRPETAEEAADRLAAEEAALARIEAFTAKRGSRARVLAAATERYVSHIGTGR